MKRTMFRAVMLCGMLSFTTVCAMAQTYFYTGASGGNFFDEANWNTMADGSGSIIPGDPLQDDIANAIALDLIIDGDNVDAPGDVDFGTGSLTLESGSVFTISGIGADLDINSDSSFFLTDATLIVDDIINFEGISIFSGGSVQSLTDDIAFQNNLANLTIDGTMFTSADTTYFDGTPASGSITNATFTVVDQFGIRDDGNGPSNIVMTNANIDVQANGGTSGGDIQNVFTSGDAIGSSLTLLGNSTLRADAIEEGAALVLGGSSEATLGVHFEERITDEGGTITLTTLEAQLNVVALDSSDPDYVDARPFLIDGRTGVDYLTSNGVGWNITDWDGFSAVSLQLVPEPGTLLLSLACIAAVAVTRRRDH